MNDLFQVGVHCGFSTQQCNFKYHGTYYNNGYVAMWHDVLNLKRQALRERIEPNDSVINLSYKWDILLKANYSQWVTLNSIQIMVWHKKEFLSSRPHDAKESEEENQPTTPPLKSL